MAHSWLLILPSSGVCGPLCWALCCSLLSGCPGAGTGVVVPVVQLQLLWEAVQYICNKYSRNRLFLLFRDRQVFIFLKQTNSELPSHQAGGNFREIPGSGLACWVVYAVPACFLSQPSPLGPTDLFQGHLFESEWGTLSLAPKILFRLNGLVLWETKSSQMFHRMIPAQTTEAMSQDSPACLETPPFQGCSSVCIIYKC